MAHRDIRIPFEIEGRHFEAVGFLKDDESSVSYDTMLQCTAGENGGVIGKDDYTFLSQRLNQLPAKFRRYSLITAQPDPGGGYNSSVSYFIWSNKKKWHDDWAGIAYKWSDKGLVLRRCP